MTWHDEILDRPSVNTIMVRGLGLLGEGLNIYCMWEGCELLWPEGRLWQIALSKDGYHNMFYPTHLTVWHWHTYESWSLCAIPLNLDRTLWLWWPIEYKESYALWFLRLGHKNATLLPCSLGMHVLGAQLPGCEEAKAPAEFPADSQHQPSGMSVSLQMIPASSPQVTSSLWVTPVDAM